MELEITDRVTIDGYSQPGASPNTLATGGTDAGILIELDGSGAGSNASGLKVRASNSVLKGLAVNRFFGSGIFVYDGVSGEATTGVKVEGNFVGTDATGTVDQGNRVGSCPLARSRTKT